MATINFFYQEHATQLMSINLDDNGLFVSIPSETENVCYEVRCEEKETGIEVTGCNCLGHRRWGHCKHCTIVQQWWNECYKPVVKPTITEVEAGNWYIVNKNTQVWMQDGEWIAVGETANAIEIVKVHLAKQDAVAEAMKIVAAPDEIIPGVNRIKGTLHVKGDPIIRAPKVTDISNKGNFGSKAFSLLR